MRLAPGGAELRRPDIADAQFIDVLSAASGLCPAASGPLISDTFLPVLRSDLHIAAAYRYDDRLEECAGNNQ